MRENQREPVAGFGITEAVRAPTPRHELSICAACGNYIPLGVRYWTDGARAWCTPLCSDNGDMLQGK